MYAIVEGCNQCIRAIFSSNQKEMHPHIIQQNVAPVDRVTMQGPKVPNTFNEEPYTANITDRLVPVRQPRQDHLTLFRMRCKTPNECHWKDEDAILD